MAKTERFIYIYNTRKKARRDKEKAQEFSKTMKSQRSRDGKYKSMAVPVVVVFIILPQHIASMKQKKCDMA